MNLRCTTLLVALLGTIPPAAFSDRTAITRAGAWEAGFSAPTHRYGHAVLGDTPEWGTLCVRGPGLERCVTLPEERVFEDIAPRLADVDRDGRSDVVVVESDRRYGAALVVYLTEASGRLRRLSTPPIGTAYRWLAPVGIADIDRDGFIELAYVDRPHLARVLRVWRYRDGKLAQIASKPGFSNHRIGDDFIVGGVRDCGRDAIELVTADAFWAHVVATRLEAGQLLERVVGPLAGDASIERALACP